jgi:hypothetical protein
MAAPVGDQGRCRSEGGAQGEGEAQGLQVLGLGGGSAHGAHGQGEGRVPWWPAVLLVPAWVATVLLVAHGGGGATGLGGRARGEGCGGGGSGLQETRCSSAMCAGGRRCPDGCGVAQENECEQEIMLRQGRAQA